MWLWPRLQKLDCPALTACIYAVVFAYQPQGATKAQEYFAGYLLEQSLSVDNLFVFILVFNYFKTPLVSRVNYVLTWFPFDCCQLICSHERKYMGEVGMTKDCFKQCK
jgi:hypothetical protein